MNYQSEEVEIQLLDPSGTEPAAHELKKGFICVTDARAQSSSPSRLVIDATEGFIPLWEPRQVLRWKFNQASLSVFRWPDRIKTRIQLLLNAAVAAWRGAAPVRFAENPDNSDFEIVVERRKDCTSQGCVLASAFFPDAGRHHLHVFPAMFEQSLKEQLDTLIHEIGHIFGLRHFFAPDQETAWPVEIFGTHRPFSIMNYGGLSELTDADRDDLKKLYQSAWNGSLTAINGTPIKLVRPFHYGD